MKGIAARATISTLFACLAATSVSAEGPLLRVLALHPITLAGEGFTHGEHLTLVLSVEGARMIREVRASPTGSFTVSFDEFVVSDRCNSDVWAHASADGTVRARAKLPQLQCPPRL
jgi:hypothetical protein